jgi:hypothetical protein
MKALLMGLVLGLSGCGLTDVHTEHYTVDQNGDQYERHYLVLPYESKCTGSCVDAHKDIPSYNMKTHKIE